MYSYAPPPPYNSNFRYFEKQSLVPKTSNLGGSAVCVSAEIRYTLQ